MGIAKTCSVGMLALGLAIVGGCASSVTLPDGTEMPESTYVALESMADKERARQENLSRLMGGFQDCDGRGLAKDEYKDCQHTNQLWLVQVPWMAQSLDDGGADAGYWNLVSQREQRRDPLRYVQAVNQTLQSLCMIGLAPWNCAIGGGGGSFTVKADGQSRIENLDVTMGDGSPFTTGNDNMTAIDEGQNQTGDGQQTRSTTRPFQQNEPNTGGGAGDNSPGAPINNNSEGLGFDGSF